MIVQKLAKLEVRMEYASFLETLVRDCCAGCEAEEIKKISNTLNLLVQEKQKLNKAKDKGKKKTATAAKKTWRVGKVTTTTRWITMMTVTTNTKISCSLSFPVLLGCRGDVTNVVRRTLSVDA